MSAPFPASETGENLSKPLKGFSSVLSALNSPPEKEKHKAHWSCGPKIYGAVGKLSFTWPLWVPCCFIMMLYHLEIDANASGIVSFSPGNYLLSSKTASNIKT